MPIAGEKDGIAELCVEDVCQLTATSIPLHRERDADETGRSQPQRCAEIQDTGQGTARTVTSE
jgi:hypothetical protein